MTSVSARLAPFGYAMILVLAGCVSWCDAGAGRFQVDRPPGSPGGRLGPGGPQGGPGGTPPMGPNGISIRSTNGKMEVTVQMRSWTARANGAQIEAILKDPANVGEEVTLIQADGTEITVKRPELSDFDNDYLRRLDQQLEIHRNGPPSGAPGRGDSMRGDMSGSLAERAGGRGRTGEDAAAGRSTGNAPAENVNFSITIIDLQSAPDFNSVDEFPSRQLEWLPTSLPDLAIPFAFDHSGHAMHVSHGGVVLSADGKRAVVGMNYKLGGEGKLIVFDMENRKVLIEQDFDSPLDPLAISPDYRTLVTGHLNLGRMSGPSIRIWELTATGMEPRKEWQAMGVPASGAFVHAGRLVLSGGPQAVVFDVEGDRVEHHTFAEQLTGVAGGNGFVVDRRRGLDLIDLAAGTRFNVTKDRGIRLGRTAISPDGRLLATLYQGMVVVADLKSGKKLVEFGAFQDLVRTFSFLTNRYLIVEDKLIDLKLQALVAELVTENLFQPVATADGSLVWVAELDGVQHRYALRTKNLLSGEFRGALDEYTGGPSFRIAPQSTVTLNAPDLEPANRAAIEKSVLARGLQVGPNGELVLDVDVKYFPRETMEVGIGGRLNGQSTTVSFVPTETTMKLTWQGREVWTRTSLNRPGKMLQGKQGETPQSTVDRLCRPSPSFFSQIGIPVNLVLYDKQPPLAIDLRTSASLKAEGKGSGEAAPWGN